jgi:large subunit ribosomal protein L33
MPRDTVILECTEAKAEGKPPSRYMTTRNKKLQTERVEKKKYNSHLKRKEVVEEFLKKGPLKRGPFLKNISPSGLHATCRDAAGSNRVGRVQTRYHTPLSRIPATCVSKSLRAQPEILGKGLNGL